MVASDDAADIPEARAEGWERPSWRVFRRLFQSALYLPEPILSVLAGQSMARTDIPALDVRARFHAWFVTRFRTATGSSPSDRRQSTLLSLALLDGLPPATVACSTITVAGPAGPLPSRLYRPVSAPKHNAPILVYFHFGGCVLGDLDTCHTACALIADKAACLVLSVAYRLAPEHRFPAAVDDALAAFRWVHACAGDIGADPQRIAIGGDSAGGYLAAAASLCLRDEGEVLPFLQLLIYPVLEMNRLAMPPTPFDRNYPLSRDDMIWFADLYMRDTRDAEDPRCSVARAERLAGLPPTLLVQAGHDLLFAEGEAFGRRLEEEEVPLVRLSYPTLPHAFTAMSGGLPKAHAALAEIAHTLAAAFAARKLVVAHSGDALL